MLEDGLGEKLGDAYFHTPVALKGGWFLYSISAREGYIVKKSIDYQFVSRARTSFVSDQPLTSAAQSISAW